MEWFKDVLFTLVALVLKSFSFLFALAILIGISLYYYPLSTTVAIISYYIWIHFIDGCHFKDGRPNKILWKYLTPFYHFSAVYYHRLETHFSPKLLSAVNDTPIDKQPPQFLFAIHPHGLTAEWRQHMHGRMYEIFTHPRFDYRVLCATILFYIPMFREVILWTHCVDANKRTALRNLRKGKSLMISVGGECEQLLTTHGKEIVYIRERKGFIRLALSNNVGLVAMYAFGVNDNFTTLNWFPSLRWRIMKMFRVALILGYGVCGTYLPYRTKTDVVCSEPIPIDSDDVKAFKTLESQSDKEGMARLVDKYHQSYIDTLERLFNDNKARFGFGDRKLEIL